MKNQLAGTTVELAGIDNRPDGDGYLLKALLHVNVGSRYCMTTLRRGDDTPSHGTYRRFCVGSCCRPLQAAHCTACGRASRSEPVDTEDALKSCCEESRSGGGTGGLDRIRDSKDFPLVNALLQCRALSYH